MDFNDNGEEIEIDVHKDSFDENEELITDKTKDAEGDSNEETRQLEYSKTRLNSLKAKKNRKKRSGRRSQIKTLNSEESIEILDEKTIISDDEILELDEDRQISEDEHEFLGHRGANSEDVSLNSGFESGENEELQDQFEEMENIDAESSLDEEKLDKSKGKIEDLKMKFNKKKKRKEKLVVDDYHNRNINGGYEEDEMKHEDNGAYEDEYGKHITVDDELVRNEFEREIQSNMTSDDVNEVSEDDRLSSNSKERSELDDFESETEKDTESKVDKGRGEGGEQLNKLILKRKKKKNGKKKVLSNEENENYHEEMKREFEETEIQEEVEVRKEGENKVKEIEDEQVIEEWHQQQTEDETPEELRDRKKKQVGGDGEEARDEEEERMREKEVEEDEKVIEEGGHEQGREEEEPEEEETLKEEEIKQAREEGQQANDEDEENMIEQEAKAFNEETRTEEEQIRKEEEEMKEVEEQEKEEGIYVSEDNAIDIDDIYHQDIGVADIKKTRKKLEELKVGKKRREKKREKRRYFDDDAVENLEEQQQVIEELKEDLDTEYEEYTRNEEFHTRKNEETFNENEQCEDNNRQENKEGLNDTNHQEAGDESVFDDVDTDVQNDDTSVYLSMTSLDARTEDNESDYHSVASFKIGSQECLDIVTGIQNVTEALSEFSLQGNGETRMRKSEADKSEDGYTTADDVMKETSEVDEEEYATAQEDDRSTIVGAGEDLVFDDEYDTAQEDAIRNEGNAAEIRIEDDEIMNMNEAEKESTSDNTRDNMADHGPGITNDQSSNKESLDTEEMEKQEHKRRKSFFSTAMAKKEAKIQLRLNAFSAREKTAKEGVTEARARMADAKSRLPLMIVEKRIPKTEANEKMQAKLKALEERLEALNIYNKRTNDYIQNWRALEGEIREKRSEFEMKRRKTCEKQKLLGACKKRRMFMETELMRHDDKQMAAKRRIKTLTDKKDMLMIRMKERRNIVNRSIKGAKKNCEMCIRKAAQVVAISRKYQELKNREKYLEDKIFKTKKSLEKMRKQVSCKKFDLERGQIQKSVKTMKKERGW